MTYIVYRETKGKTSVLVHSLVSLFVAVLVVTLTETDLVPTPRFTPLIVSLVPPTCGPLVGITSLITGVYK